MRWAKLVSVPSFLYAATPAAIGSPVRLITWTL
jgi:hypothetical protein